MYNLAVSRRLFLKGTSLVGGYAATSSAVVKANEFVFATPISAGRDSTIGYWRKDKSDLPVFRYIAKPFEQGVEIRKTVALEYDPYFLLGNYRLTAFVHSSGVVRIMSGERAWAKLNEGIDAKPGNRAKLSIKSISGEKNIELIGDIGIGRDPQYCARDFGVGYANFAYKTESIECRRTISVSPSNAINKGIPAYLVEIELLNNAAHEQEFIYEETILTHYVACIDRGSPESKWPVKYTYSVDPAAGEDLISCKISAHPKEPSMKTSDTQASRNDLHPAGLFMQIPRELNNSVKSQVFSTDAENNGKHLGVRFSLNIPSGKRVKFCFFIGIQNPSGTVDITSLVNAVIANKPDQEFPFISEWKTILPSFSNEKNKTLSSEMQWNAYVLESMANYSTFYQETYIPQGMTYDYVLGTTAAPRDHLQHCLPLCYTNPALAKSAIRFVLKKMTYQGEIKFSDIGYGRTSNSAWSTSDQQLFLFMAVAEYLRVTHDVAFLEEKTEFLPMEANYSATTLEKLRRAFAYLRDEVGVGPHGLIRLMNSDWSDMIFVEAPVMKHFFTAESHMNSAMGLCVLPALIQQLEKSVPSLSDDNKTLAGNLIAGIGQFEAKNRAAFYKDLQARPFSRRIYLSGGSSLGDQDLYIEPQIFLMQDGKYPIEKKKILWEEIQKRLLKNELLGPRQRERSEPSPKYGRGTCENGGLWYSLTGPLIVGLASFDKKAALCLLERLTFSHFTKCYPDYWVGHWTAPDTLNTFESGELAGLPRPEDAGFWFNFAAYCAHPHAWPLYAYLRITANDFISE